MSIFRQTTMLSLLSLCQSVNFLRNDDNWRFHIFSFYLAIFLLETVWIWLYFDDPNEVQLLQSVLNLAVRLIRGLGRFDHITRFLLTCTGYRTPSIFLTRSVCLCSSVWKAWPLPIFLISVLALRLLWVVLVWDPPLEVILLCWDTGQSGVQGLLLWLARNVGTNCWLDLSVGPEIFARHLKTHLFRAGFSD